MRKASCHHEKLKMSGSGKKSGKEHFFYKTCNWQVSGSFTSCMVVQNKGKEMYNKVCCTKKKKKKNKKVRVHLSK